MHVIGSQDIWKDQSDERVIKVRESERRAVTTVNAAENVNTVNLFLRMCGFSVSANRRKLYQITRLCMGN